MIITHSYKFLASLWPWCRILSDMHCQIAVYSDLIFWNHFGGSQAASSGQTQRPVQSILLFPPFHCDPESSLDCWDLAGDRVRTIRSMLRVGD